MVYQGSMITLLSITSLGRSERSGFFSQQYVLADAGFKSFIPVQSANQWMMSANFSTTIWRGFEFYMAWCWIKNKGKKTILYMMLDLV